MSDAIFDAYSACARFIDIGQDALEEKFATGDGDVDSPGARLAMLQSVNAAKELRSNLEKGFEFGNDVSCEKEDGCRD